MQYRDSAARLLEDVILKLRTLDELTEVYPSHRLDLFELLIIRLEAIRSDLLRDSGLLAATRKTGELRARLIGGIWGIDDSRYRSSLAI
jgi:hypothetical protein